MRTPYWSLQKLAASKKRHPGSRSRQKDTSWGVALGWCSSAARPSASSRRGKMWMGTSRFIRPRASSTIRYSSSMGPSSSAMQPMLMQLPCT